MTDADVARIPPGNLRVPRAEFAAVWAAAEQLCDEKAGRGITDWYAGGVAITCAWLAAAVVETRAAGRHPAYSPVTKRRAMAYEELIEAEFLAAELLDVRRPDLLVDRPGWCEAVRATLRWAWRHEGPPPLALPATATG